MNKMPEFAADATNVYRTKKYIVKQVFGLRLDDRLGSQAMSFDTYFVRTSERDLLYEMFYADRMDIDGKRLPTTMYTRKYID